MPANNSNSDPPKVGTAEERKYKMPRWDVEEDVVISGISGRFPESDNVEELKHNLYEGVDMITENERRWKPGLFGTPKRMGKLKEITRFDRQFFGVHGKQAQSMDPMHRLLLESTYEAIFDSGYEPSSLRGRNIGVFIGCSDKSISGDAVSEDVLTGYELLGMATALLANRISFTFGFTGPSMAVDTACSSTMHALNEAIIAIRTNRCDAAIIGGATISLSVSQTISFARLGLVSQEGTCKVFDATANGYVRSEAVGAIFIQRASEARRNYATILHCKLNNDGAKVEGISFPSAKQQKQLFKEVYCELGFNPADIDYVEAHGTGTVAGDREESNAIADFFCEGRTTPLLVGSVKSNLGHAEAASGTCTIAKVILSMEEGVIPPNIHYKEPNPHVPALLDGSMKVIAEKTPWKPGVVATNNFGFGGSNAHIVLKANQREPSLARDRKIPRLVLCSGRSEEGVKHIFKKIEEEKYTDESLVLLEEACKAPTIGMRFRGYGLVQKPGDEIQVVVERAPTDTRPVWFLFSGMGSQWSGMAKEMMKLGLFAKSINMSAQVLKPYGVDLIHLLTDASEEELNHIVAPFVTIAATQIALVDVVRTLGIKPDGIIGHSVGELGCAYADGCFTAEQMLMAAYWRGQSCAQTRLIHGAMAAVGMTWEEAKKRCPEGIYPVCHNAEDSVTISGPYQKVKQFVEHLNAENIFARNVKTCDIAFHSKYVEPAAVIMRKELSRVIPNPLPRSARWVSSSVPEEEWCDPHAQLSSVDYHVNNLLSPVLFDEAMKKVPKGALIIEFAPHSLLQAIIKRIMGPDSIYIGLMKKQHEDNLVHCLSAIGKMYTSNLNPAAKNLYEPVTYPVPRGTAMLNSLIRWDHSETVDTWSFAEFHKHKDDIFVDTFRGLRDDYLTGHKVDGRILFPFMGYVLLAWKALARFLLMEIDEVPLIIEDFSVFRASILPKTGKYVFQMKFLDCDGNFRIMEGGSIVASGRARQGGDSVLSINDKNMESIQNLDLEDSFTLNAEDFYKELRLRGYEYGPTFQGVTNADATGLRGKIKWEGRWVSFMDAMLQVPILCVPARALLLPTRVKCIRIDPRKAPDINAEVELHFNPHINVCRAGPVEIQGIHCGVAPRRKDYQSIPVLETQSFVPLYDSCILTEKEINEVEEYCHVCATIAHKILNAHGKNKSEISAVMNGFKEAPEELTEIYLKKEQSNHVLLKVLKEISDLGCENGFKDNVKTVTDKYSSEVYNDFLSMVALNEAGLRAALDVVQDNFFTTKVKVLEASVSTVFRKDVLKALGMTTLGLVKYDYTLARLTEAPIPEALVDSSIKPLQCDLKETVLPTENDLTVAKYIFTDSVLPLQETINALSASVKENGFVLLVERTTISPAEKVLAILTDTDKQEQNEKRLEEAFEGAGLTLISKKKDQVTSVIYLLRKIPSGDRVLPKIIELADDLDFSWVEELKTTLKEYQERSDDPKLWLYSKNPTNGIVGLVNCLKQEPGNRCLRYFFNASQSEYDVFPDFNPSETFFKKIMAYDLTSNIYKDGQWGNFRHRQIEKEPVPQPRVNSFLNITNRGDLSSFKWIESPLKFKTFDPRLRNEVFVQLYYSALNFKDIMLASGKLPPDAIPKNLALKECLLGMEFVGRDPKGRRVMGITMSKGLATTVSVSSEALFDVPDHWSMEEACTVPVVYMTAYYALLIRGRMRRGQSILIHSGSGGVGQAAIAIALSMNCQVYTTVGSDEKREYLKTVFPELDDLHISNSRTVEFEYNILNATCGKGVDIVLNSLADDKLQASVRCLKTNGIFLEIGKYDIAMNSKLGMSLFGKNISFHGVHLDVIMDHDSNQEEVKELRAILYQGVRTGVVRPLKTNIYNWDQAEEAFRFMASGKHVGKILLKIRDEEERKEHLPSTIEIPSVTRTYCHPTKSYIVTGGLGGFGLELANWLVDRGARFLLLSTRTGIHNEYQRLWIHRWRRAGVTVVISNQDLSTLDGTRMLLKEAADMATVGGIFHLAMVLHDGLLENLKPDDFEEVSQSKIKGVHNLDLLSRDLCPDLDFFLVFSSISCGRGNAGQSNYGYANSAMERVVELRKSQGLPGLAIQWGGIGDVGVVYEKMGGNEVILKGTVPQRLSSCLAVMDRLLQEDNAVVSSFVPVEKAAFSADSKEDVVALLCKVLGIKDPSSVKPDMTLGELGMDSLMGVEIKQVLESDYDTVLTVPEVRQLSIRQLEEIGKNKRNAESNPVVMEKKEGIAMVGEIYVPMEILVPMNNVTSPHCVFFFHAMEGHINMLKPLARHLNRKVYGLQFTDAVPAGTLQEVASCYIEHIKSVQPHGPYQLVAYSYGTLVALEVALQLQKTDQVKNFICIDGSPFGIGELCRTIVTEDKMEDLHCTATPIKLFLQNFFVNIPPMIEERILNLPKGEMISQGILIVQETFGEVIDYDTSLKIIQRLYTLCWLGKNYPGKGVYRGKATLVKSNGEDFPEELKAGASIKDYNLGENVDGTLEVLTLPYSHREIIYDYSNEMSTIINERL